MRDHRTRFAAILLLMGSTLYAVGQQKEAKSAAAAPTQPVSVPVVQPMQPYTSTDGRFSVLFPGAPTLSTETISLKNGEKVLLYEVSAEGDGGNTSYIVMYNDYQADVITGPPQDLLKRTRDGAVAGKTLLSDTEIELGGVPGRAYTATDSDGWGYDVHEFLAGARFYQLIITTAKGHTATQRDQFMNSFSIQ